MGLGDERGRIKAERGVQGRGRAGGPAMQQIKKWRRRRLGGDRFDDEMQV